MKVNLDNVEKLDLCKNVTVYKNAYKSTKELKEAFYTAPHGDSYVLNQEDDYYDFGRKRSCRDSLVDYSELTFNSNAPESDDSAFLPIASLLATYDACLEDFQRRHNISLSIKEKTILQVRYYEPGTGCGWHFDYEGYRPDENFTKEPDYEYSNYSVTLNCYLNSDYEGGELSFRLNNKEISDQYQPKEGDVILFPSGYPYEHSINTVETNKRWFTNYMLIENNEPTWHFSLNDEPTEYFYYKDYEIKTK